MDKLAIDGLESPPARLTAVGDPAEKIAEFTRDNGVDLVMLPTHGHGLFRWLLLGSVTSKVLHDVHCPVWTAAHAEKQHAQEVPRKILCALDGSEKSLALAQWAADFSRRWARACSYCTWCGPSAIGCRWKASRRCRRSCGRNRAPESRAA